jgi:SAM-dependent methyltransferase
MVRVSSSVLCSVVALAGVVVLASALPSGTSAQPRMKKSEPTLIYVPTPQSVVDKMLEVAKVTKDDYVFDLGSGDGRIPITAAARYGARGFGVDINPKLIAEARANAKIAGVSDRVEFRRQDLFKTSVRDATVVGLYLFVWANEKLRPRLINELRPGSRIVAHDFPIGDDWKPDIEEEIENRTVFSGTCPRRWRANGRSPVARRGSRFYCNSGSRRSRAPPQSTGARCRCRTRRCAATRSSSRSRSMAASRCCSAAG